MRSRELPAEVQAACSSFLDATPEVLVTGLYLRGGVGFGEWVPAQSDVDFVATLGHRPDEAEVEALRWAHEAVAQEQPDLHFDGPHVLASDLAADPRSCPEVPIVMARRFEEKGHVGDAVVTWHELAWHGTTILGPPLEELEIWTSPAVLATFTRENLDTYWRGNAEALSAMPREGAREEACCWCVLGVARLHHLLVTGRMTTKSQAGRWGLQHYPEEHHRVIREAIRIREGGANEYRGEDDRRGLDTARFTAYVVEQGTRPAD